MTAPLVFTENRVDAYACTLSGVTATAPDGSTHPLDRCAWMQISPCGCVSGITMAFHGDSTILTSPDAALLSMAHNAADAKEDAKLGYRMVLVTMDDYRANLIELIKSSCPHDPKWGHARKAREVGGKTWIRMGSTEWRHKDADGGSWRLEKYSGYWSVMPPSKYNRTGMRIPGMGSALDRALENASRYVDQLTAAAIA